MILVVQIRVIAGGETWNDVRYHTHVAPPRLAAAAALQRGDVPALVLGLSKVEDRTIEGTVMHRSCHRCAPSSVEAYTNQSVWCSPNDEVIDRVGLFVVTACGSSPAATLGAARAAELGTGGQRDFARAAALCDEGRGPLGACFALLDAIGEARGTAPSLTGVWRPSLRAGAVEGVA